MTALTLACLIGSAMAAGAFFTFSDFTIRGLRKLPPRHGAAAMQAINRAAPSPLFMLLLFGTGAACVVLAVRAGLDSSAPGNALRIVGGATYFVGVVMTTVLYHVPRNNRLERVDPDSDEGQRYWSLYLSQWVPMNHVRTVAPLVTATLLALTC